MPAPSFLTNARLIDPASGSDGPGALRVSGGGVGEGVRQRAAIRAAWGVLTPSPS